MLFYRATAKNPERFGLVLYYNASHGSLAHPPDGPKIGPAPGYRPVAAARAKPRAGLAQATAFVAY